MSRLNSFIRSIKWWQLIPSGLNGMQTLITDPDNIDTSASYVSAAAAKDGSLLVAYVPPAHKGIITVNMKALSSNVYAYWYDPTSGKYATIRYAPFKNNGIQSFTPPSHNGAGETDFVLMLSAKKRG